CARELIARDLAPRREVLRDTFRLRAAHLGELHPGFEQLLPVGRLRHAVLLRCLGNEPTARVPVQPVSATWSLGRVPAVVLPLRDDNPTSRVPVITIALIAINLFVYFLVQPHTGTDASQVYLYHYAAIPCEITTG